LLANLSGSFVRIAAKSPKQTINNRQSTAIGSTASNKLVAIHLSL